METTTAPTGTDLVPASVPAATVSPQMAQQVMRLAADRLVQAAQEHATLAPPTQEEIAAEVDRQNAEHLRARRAGLRMLAAFAVLVAALLALLILRVVVSLF